jgi:hypothetical protein
MMTQSQKKRIYSTTLTPLFKLKGTRVTMARIVLDIIPLAGSRPTVGPDGPEYQPFPVGPSLPEATLCRL